MYYFKKHIEYLARVNGIRHKIPTEGMHRGCNDRWHQHEKDLKMILCAITSINLKAKKTWTNS